MHLVTVTIKRDALTAITIEVPDYEVPVLLALHEDMLDVKDARRYLTPPVDVDGKPLPFDFQAAWNLLMAKYKRAGTEDRKESTGHPLLQAYGNFHNFVQRVRPMLNAGKPKAKKVAPPPKPKRSHKKKPAVAPAENTLQA